MRKITYITGTRADFGLMKGVLHSIDEAQDLSINLIVTGMHLLQEYGSTINEVEATELSILAKVPVELSGGEGREMAVSLGKQLIGITEALVSNRPDILLLLGDRGEMLAGAIAALHLNIHTVHIHGGELSGTIDESIRHAISKLSHYHFTSTNASRARLIKMGEKPEAVFVTGAPGLDSILSAPLYEEEVIFSRLGLANRPTALVLFHPVVQQAARAREQMEALLSALLETGLQIIILLPNADSGGGAIRSVIEKYIECDGVFGLVHLSRVEFLSLVSVSSVMVGNSSSGIIEAASLGTPVVNVGDRQNNRERNQNIVDCGYTKVDIYRATNKALAIGKDEYKNIYGDGNAVPRILEHLRNVNLSKNVLEKVNAY